MTFYELKEIFGSHFFKTWLIYIYIYIYREREREREREGFSGGGDYQWFVQVSFLLLPRKKKNEVAVIS